MDYLTEEFLKITDQFQGIITNLCRAYYTSLEDRRDARQDIILQLWKSFKTFKGESSISTWIYRVSLNTILNKRRKEAKRVDKESIHVLRNTIAAKVGFNDTNQLLEHLLNSLKYEDKAIFILKLEGYGNQEIADLLGLSTTNVSTKIYRIKNTLKKKYKEVKPWI